MDEGDDWANLFFSGQPPDFVKTLSNNPDFRPFSPETDEWELGRRVDEFRESHGTRIQVFWLRIEGHRKYVAKVFPDYTPAQAAAQLRRFYVPYSRIQSQIDSTVSEYDAFLRESRAYSHIERFCPSHERGYFPHFHGVLTDLPRSRFTSGYANPRAIVLEALIARPHSRRILSADLSCLPDSFQQTIDSLPLSSFERAWYSSLLCDRLHRLASLHRIGIIHGEVKDCHFRLPGDMYDTVLYDFSRSYTFTPRRPLRVGAMRSAPLEKIAEIERKHVEFTVQELAIARDFRSHLAASLAGQDVDDVLCRPLDQEVGSLELIVLKVRTRPDYFLMPSLNSVFPFLEAIRPEGDSTWHIRRCRLLDCYDSVWATFSSPNDSPSSVVLYHEPDFETSGSKKQQFILCLVPTAWEVTVSCNDAGLCDNLRHICSHFISLKTAGHIVKRQDFFGSENAEEHSNTIS